MTICEEKFNNACMNSYKEDGEISKYDPSFLRNLPCLYFLGLPIKEIIKSDYSNTLCHALSLAIGMCFDEYEVVTANLKNYNEYRNIKLDENSPEFNHSFTVVKLNGKKKVIDPVIGITTEEETYNDIYGVQIKFRLNKKALENVPSIKYIAVNLNNICPMLDEHGTPEEIKAYRENLRTYNAMCLDYENPNDYSLEYFVKRCLSATTSFGVISNLINKLIKNKFENTYSDSTTYEVDFKKKVIKYC